MILISFDLDSSNPKEQSGLLYQYGLGKPIGKFFVPRSSNDY